MCNLVKRVGVFLFSMVFFLLAMSSVILAENYRPGRGGHRGGYSVAEPSAIVLLGAGLVSLGFYARRKRNKK